MLHQAKVPFAPTHLLCCGSCQHHSQAQAQAQAQAHPHHLYFWLPLAPKATGCHVGWGTCVLFEMWCIMMALCCFTCKLDEKISDTNCPCQVGAPRSASLINFPFPLRTALSLNRQGLITSSPWWLWGDSEECKDTGQEEGGQALLPVHKPIA